MNVVTIVGARPQFIKAAVVSRAIHGHNSKYSSDQSTEQIQEILVHTGQHYDDNMSKIFFEDLGIPIPDYNLRVGSGSQGAQTGAMLAKIEQVLNVEKPNWVLVYGDTNSTLAGALAAVKLHIPVVHVEAGLRSFNRAMPEEINRIVADQLSTLLLCPSQTAVANLAREGIVCNVHLVGDVTYDALLFAVERARERSQILERLNLTERGFLLATVHRAENTDDSRRLKAIVRALEALGADEPVVFPIHPHTRKLLEEAGIQPRASHLLIIEPVGYLDMIMLEGAARIILTDSGGVQKEAYWLSVPCVTLRDETEWFETADTG